MAYIWRIHGLYMAYTWLIYGLYMAYIWQPRLCEASWPRRYARVCACVRSSGCEAVAEGRRQAHTGHYYIGHNYIGHYYIGHNYIGHNYTGHNSIGHNYIGP